MANILTWTVIPVGLKDGKHPIVAVYLSPRLGPPPSGASNPTLGMYDDFKDWPETITSNIKFTLNVLRLDSDQPLGSMDTQILSEPDSRMWRSLFPSETPVKANPVPAKDGRLQRKYESYDVRKFSGHIQSSLVNVATASAKSALQADRRTARGLVASLESMPLPKPTAGEVMNEFARSNLFFPLTPSEPEKECQRLTLLALARWVAAEEGDHERHQILRQAEAFLSRLGPRVGADFRGLAPRTGSDTAGDVKLLFKGEVIRAVVDRFVALLHVSGPEWPDPMHCAPEVKVDLLALPDPMKLEDHINHAHFHRALPPLEPQEEPCDPYDFHELISMLGSHPFLYPHVGLVFDLLGKAELPQSERARVSVTVDFPSRGLIQKPVCLYPKTAYQIFERPAQQHNGSARQFFLPGSRQKGAQPNPNSPDDVIDMGILDVSDPNRFHLETMDTHGDYYKTARQDYTGAPESPDAHPDREVPTPKLRSCGLALARANRVDKLGSVATINQQHLKNLDQSGSTTFYAEDLTVGYRVDACAFPDPTGNPNQRQWKSLCLRNTTWKFTDSAGSSWDWAPEITGDCRKIQARDDSMPLTEYDKLKCLRLEGIVHSASTQPVDTKADEHQVLETLFRWENWSLSVPVPIKNFPEPKVNGECQRKPLQLRAKHSVINHSLPPLRYGWAYYIRCRAAFLDGSGLSLEDSDDQMSKIGAPDNQPFTYRRIESVDTPTLLLADPLDIKNRPGEQMNVLVVRDGNEMCERFVVPPRVSPYLAYLHGSFDADQEGAFSDFIWTPDGLFATVAQFLGHKSDRPEEQNVIFAERRNTDIEVKHPYFPDPAADCARINLLHRRTVSRSDTELFGFYNSVDDWPDAQPLLIVLAGPDPGQKEDAVLTWGTRRRGRATLWVTLKEGRVAKLVLSSCLQPTKSRSKSLGPLFKFFDSLNLQFIRLAETNGQRRPEADSHWLLASQTEVQLVHAVKKPLVNPSLELKLYQDQLTIGNPGVKIHAQAYLCADSTGKIDISAQWTDDIDDETKPRSDTQSSHETKSQSNIRSVKSHVHTRAIELQPVEQQGENSPGFDFEHNFGDTKHHMTTYSISATSRFVSYYKSSPEDANNGRFVSFDSKNDRILCIPNRARPDKPKILYLIPSFRWDDQEIKHGRIHHRWGGGIRVYLDRGWYSSGNGELLGILLPEDKTLERPDLITQMGMDPLWDAPSVPGSPKIEDFQELAGFIRRCAGNTTEEFSLSNLTLEEKPGLTVTTVGYKPKFDVERQIWYCDIILSPQKAYYPFVRFAFARFQPNSINGAHLSNVITADFAQLAPDRWIVLQKQKHRVTVTVYGYSYKAAFASTEPSQMVFTIEEKISGMKDELCWIPATDPKTKRPLLERVKAEAASAIEKLKLLQNKLGDIPADVYVWRKDFDLPRWAFATRHRLLVQEVETFKSDDRGAGKSLEDTKLCDRLVFADVLGI